MGPIAATYKALLAGASLLWASVLNSFVQEIIVLRMDANKGVLAMIAIVIYAFLMIVIVCLSCASGGDRIVIGVLATCLYLYGDNITPILEHHGEYLGCDENCIYYVRISAIVALGLILCFLFCGCGFMCEELTEIEKEMTKRPKTRI